MKRLARALLPVLLALMLCGCEADGPGAGQAAPSAPEAQAESGAAPEGVPEYSGSPSDELGPAGFSPEEVRSESFEDYAPLDSLGRAGTATACLGLDTLPTKERGDISEVRPSGWAQASYEFVDGGKLYNRCHLIAHSLAGEDANPQNLMTGTRTFNIEGMEPFERQVRKYIEQTGNHVMYRTAPDFRGDELVARGVRMDALSVEDGGAGVNRAVYCHNVEPGVEIDYATGASRKAGEKEAESREEEGAASYVLNTSSKKAHLPSCPSAAKISAGNREETDKGPDELRALGYSPCGSCRPF